MSSLRVAVAGATGYSGQELLRRLARHPHARVVAALASAATDTLRRLPALARIWDGDILPFTADAIVGRADAAFLALPEEAAASIAPMLAQAGVRVFDLSGAFRLRDAGVRARWYPATPDPLPPHTLYALPEFTADSLPEAQIVSCPGCYPTAALLALAPLARAGLLASHDVIVDAKSGISGAGKGATERTHFSENHGSVAAYKAFAHRHTPEIEQELARTVTFVPHLVPLDRGILCTTYTRVTPGTTAATIAAAFDQAYDGRPFVRVTGTRLPEIKHVVHSNFCDVGWALDVESHRLVVVSVIDNLVKGAAGQAIQNFNLAYGLDEREGLL
jgi:N-acetyl-gamma-glutamyl-phosphate reductase